MKLKTIAQLLPRLFDGEEFNSLPANCQTLLMDLKKSDINTTDMLEKIIALRGEAEGISDKKSEVYLRIKFFCHHIQQKCEMDANKLNDELGYKDCMLFLKTFYLTVLEERPRSLKKPIKMNSKRKAFFEKLDELISKNENDYQLQGAVKQYLNDTQKKKNHLLHTLFSLLGEAFDREIASEILSVEPTPKRKLTLKAEPKHFAGFVFSLLESIHSLVPDSPIYAFKTKLMDGADLKSTLEEASLSVRLSTDNKNMFLRILFKKLSLQCDQNPSQTEIQYLMTMRLLANVAVDYFKEMLRTSKSKTLSSLESKLQSIFLDLNNAGKDPDTTLAELLSLQLKENYDHLFLLKIIQSTESFFKSPSLDSSVSSSSAAAAAPSRTSVGSYSGSMFAHKNQPPVEEDKMRARASTDVELPKTNIFSS